MRTPSSALPAAPQDLVLGRGRPFDAAALPGFFDFNFTTFLAAVFDLALVLALLRFLVIARSPLISVDARQIGHAHCFLRTTLCGLRLPMRPLSLPAAGSITALMSVGLPESIALFTARLSSSGVVTFAPTPPNASMILS